MTQKRSILSGMRPTGKLHIGHWIGVLSNWVKLQEDSDCFYMVADWHALTTDYEDTSKIPSNIDEMVIDWLAAGLDPGKSVIFRQSWVKPHAELALLLSMITPLSWLERNPTYKEQMVEIKEKDISTHGFLGYPVLQAADILLYKATHVPVGEDQLPHLELTREIARRFNFLMKKTVFVEPQAILSASPKLLGTDGRKMSKSYGNCVSLSDPEATLSKKINSMFTDPLKIRANDHGHPIPCPENPTGCVVYSLHVVFENHKEKSGARARACMDGTLSCSQCKRELFELMNDSMRPMREKRAALLQNKNIVQDVLKAGTEKADAMAQKTLSEAVHAMHLK